jgi:hypothetical protein
VPLGRAHYESFYLKASDPDGRVGIWIRHTVLKPPGRVPAGSVWLTLFDRDGDRPMALKASVSDGELRTGEGEYIGVGESALRSGRATGSVAAEGAGEARWELAFDEGAEQFPYLPGAWMYERPLPRTKATCLYPASTFRGEIVVRGQRYAVDGWPGMVGHNWGQEHAYRSSWIQGANFEEQQQAYLDVVLARIKIGPALTPWIANGCLSIDGQRHRLGGARPGATSFHESPAGASFSLRGDRMTVDGEVSAPVDRFIAWRYGEPRGGWHPTMNCSIADMRLRVKPGSGPERMLTVTGGAALELQLRNQEPGVPLEPFPDP